MGNKYSKQRDSARVKCYELAAMNGEESELATNTEVINERSFIRTSERLAALPTALLNRT